MGKVYCLYTGRDGQSHFADDELALKADAVGRLTTGVLAARGWMYAVSPQERFVDWHTSGRWRCLGDARGLHGPRDRQWRAASAGRGRRADRARYGGPGPPFDAWARTRAACR